MGQHRLGTNIKEKGKQKKGRGFSVRTALCDSPVINDRDGVAARQHVQCVRHQDAGGSRHRAADALLEQVFPDVHIDRGEDVVEDVNICAAVACPSEGDPRLLTPCMIQPSGIDSAHGSYCAALR